jgi:hypothetical protein
LPDRPSIVERLAAQALSGPPLKGPVEVAERLLAVQAQDARGARLAVRARTEGLTAPDVDRCLTDDRSLVISWLNRGTLHLVRSDDLPWLHALTTPPLLTGNSRRLEQEGVGIGEADRGVAEIERALAAEGPMTRGALRDRLRSAGVRTEGQALVHILARATFRGLIVRGPMVGRQHAFVLVRDWLGESPPVERDAALAELARRFLVGHGPAADRDLAKWAGLPLRDARAGLSAISSELEEVGAGLLRLSGARREGGMPPPRLLGAFDPVLLGWTSREEILGRHAARIVSGGLFRPFVMVEGRAVGGWRWTDGAAEVEAYERLPTAQRRALGEEVADVARFLTAGLPDS